MKLTKTPADTVKKVVVANPLASIQVKPTIPGKPATAKTLADLEQEAKNLQAEVNTLENGNSTANAGETTSSAK